MLINDLKYWKFISNYKGKYLGLDNPEAPGFRPHRPELWFEKYPVQDFDYDFNLWGFRGPDYCEYVAQPVNICLGDSFTVNLGGPIEHSWASQLGKLLDLRDRRRHVTASRRVPTINLGMDGAGNDAIRLVYDRACEVFDVQETFVMYSYFHRRLIDNEFTHYGKQKLVKQAPPHTDYENQVYFTENMIVEAHEAFIPDWCYTHEEMYLIDNHPHFDYPRGGKNLWTNRDYHHMNEELNGKVAEYFYELSSTNT